MALLRIGLVALVFACVAPAQDGVTAWVSELLRNKDDTDSAVIERLGQAKTREAAEGLIKAFDVVGSLRKRREIVRALANYANVPDAEQPALTKLANIAGAEDHQDLRDEAIAAIGSSPKFGRVLLKKMVDAEGSDAIRQAALTEHVKGALAEDAAWYRYLWNFKQEQRKDSKGNIAAPELNAIREVAFAGLQPFATEDELIEGLKRENDPKIKRAILAWMHKQSMPKTEEMAQWQLERPDAEGVVRAAAATILMDRARAKAVPIFLELAKKRDVTQEDLRQRMALLIAEMGDEATDKKLVKLIGKGKPHEKVFVLMATEKVNDPKVVALIRKGLADEALEVRRATGQVLGSRRDRESVPELRAMLAKPKVPDDVRIALEAITAIEGTTSAWLKELAGFTTHADRDVRNAAIDVLAKARDKRQIEALFAALEHPDWATRTCAVEALEQLRDKRVVPKLIARLGEESGRLKRRIADALWQLTAQPLEDDPARWQGWWAEAGEKFEVATEKDIDKAQAERERRKLDERTVAKSKFFGIRVESRRVTFVIDTSGSMLESMYGRFIGKRGAARIDVAKEELKQAIANLEPGTLFNILAFGSSVAAWQKERVAVLDDATRAAAIEWVDRLGANGATNLYDTVKMAFADPDVDTIFIMSDGEPTNGEVTDPHRIREDVAFWNKHRKVKINTIAIGGNLEILEWLAQDANGTYLQMR